MPGGIALTSPVAGTVITSVALLNIYLVETDLSTAKTNAVNAAIEQVQTYCGRTFESTRVRRWYQLKHSGTLHIDDRPLITLNRLAVGTQNGLSLSYVSTSATAATVAGTEAKATLHSFAAGAATNTDCAFATYLSTTTLATYIESLAGWTSAVVTDADSYGIKSSAPQDALNTTVYLEVPDDEITAAGVDVDAGIVYLPWTFTGWLYADYTAGCAVVPAGLVQVATEIAAAILKGSGVTGGMQSERIGDYQYTVAAEGLMSQYVGRLDLYRRMSL
jgi:hypothetical protein